MTKIRLDVAMVERGLAPSREKARARIMAGEVRVNGVPATKAGQEVQEEAEITVTGDAIPFVSRGGLKLDKAVRVFPISLNGRVCVDIGASTGGFKRCKPRVCGGRGLRSVGLETQNRWPCDRHGAHQCQIHGEVLVSEPDLLRIHRRFLHLPEVDFASAVRLLGGGWRGRCAHQTAI